MVAGESTPPPAAPPEGAPGRKKLLVLVVVAVLIVAGLGVVAYVLLSGGQPPAEAQLARVEVTSAGGTTINQRDEVTISAAAFDTYNVTRTTEATFSWSVSPAAKVLITPASGNRQVTITAIESGAVTLTASATWKTVTKSGSLGLTIRALQFDIVASANTPRRDDTVTLNVTVLLPNSTTYTGYRGTVNFTADIPAAASLPADTGFAASDMGRKGFPVTVLSVGVVRITVRDTVANISGSISLTVIPKDAPTAAFTLSRTKLHVDVDASASSDPNNDIATYEWTWGDSSPNTGPSASRLAAHDYATAGAYSITLKVVDATSLQGATTKKVSVAISTLDYEFYDFFNVPYGEWWDYRSAIYGDLPIRAECFNATSIADGVCTPTNTSLADYSTYPYTNWYPLPGNIKYDNPNNVPLIYAPYKFRAKGVDVGGYNLSEPVFLPVLNYSEAAGTRLDFDWRMQYMDVATMDYLRDVALCPGVENGTQDGFKIRSQITLTMDLQESRRIFGVVAADAAAASTWWNSNIAAGCLAQGLVETKFSNWFISMGGSAPAVGKYDIYNSFEWYYQPFYTNMTATVDPDGTTRVSIDYAAWGTEVVLARMFYWGNTSYQNNYLDSTKAKGWWGMELSWFENFAFAGSLKAAGFDFNLSTVLQYHFQLLSMPGPNGLYDGTDDIPYWTWGPILTDYTNDASARHLLSELDRYPYPAYSYNHSTPGGMSYGQNLAYDYGPVRWDLQAGQTWHFQFPTGNVIFYDPNLTPVPANPTSNDHVPVYAQLKYRSTNPLGYGDWNVSAMTWDVYGPSTTGGPAGSPGADGTPGTADDQYALESWGSLLLVTGVSVAVTSTLSASAAASGSPSLAESLIVSVSADSGIFVAQVSVEPNARRSRD